MNFGNYLEVLLNVKTSKDLLSDCNGIQTQNHLVSKRALNRLAKLWVRTPLQSLKLKISRLFRARSSLIFRQPMSLDSL